MKKKPIISLYKSKKKMFFILFIICSAYLHFPEYAQNRDKTLEALDKIDAILSKKEPEYLDKMDKIVEKLNEESIEKLDRFEAIINKSGGRKPFGNLMSEEKGNNL